MPSMSVAATNLIETAGALAASQTAFANVSASQTDNALVAAVTGKQIRVTAFTILTAATATNVTFNTKPAGGGTAISPLFPCGANGGLSTAVNPGGWFTTNVAEGLTVTTGAGSTTAVQVTYVLV